MSGGSTNWPGVLLASAQFVRTTARPWEDREEARRKNKPHFKARKWDAEVS